ncbi:MAG: cation diffusion facilitator family transporter, partial [Bacteroidales bacterium]|nr:cation diffusion facilitator family transporter [Bacteroidales bacterium]
MKDGSLSGNMERRQRRLQKVTIIGSVVNLTLVTLKFVAGTVGHSAAMLADAVHSCSDFATDVVVLIFVKLGAKPWDESHDYGHGKFETLATFLIGVTLLAVGVLIAVGGVRKIVFVAGGGVLPSPGMLAFIVALFSIVSKEWTYRFTVRAGKEEHSETVVANAWHHRS